MSCHCQIALVSLVIMTFPASTGRNVDVDKKGMCMFGKLFVVRVVLHEIDLLDIYIYIERDIKTHIHTQIDMKGRAKPTPCDTSECGREKKGFCDGLDLYIGCPPRSACCLPCRTKS